MNNTEKNIRFESGKEYTLSQLFSGEHTKIIIPDLQRDYCWGDKAWDKDKNTKTELVSGFVKNLIEAFNDKPDSQLTLGLIYGYENPRYHINLADGQQRITTLYLIIGMLYKISRINFKKNRNNIDEAEKILMNLKKQRDLLISKFEYKKDDHEPHLQYAIRETTLYFLTDLVSEFFLKKVVSVDKIIVQDWYFNEYDLDASIQSMLAALKTIQKLFDDNQDFDFEKFGEFIVNKLQLIYYDMGNRTRGEETFVIINTTGEPLSATENLKPILIGNIKNKEKRDKASNEWEKREEFFWQNRNKDEQTADNGHNVFFVWYVKITQIQADVNTKKYFKEIKDRLKELERINNLFQALNKLIGLLNQKEIQKQFKFINNNKELKSIQDLRRLNAIQQHNFLLPLLIFLNKFENKNEEKTIEFVRRIRKNYFDKEWKEREHNYVDWRHIIQIIELSEDEEDVLKFETKKNEEKFKSIANVNLNEWYNEEEKIKTELKEIDKQKVEDWEDYEDFMGDISPLLYAYSLEKDKLKQIKYDWLNFTHDKIIISKDANNQLLKDINKLSENLNYYFSLYDKIKNSLWFKVLQARFTRKNKFYETWLKAGRNESYLYKRWHVKKKTLIYQNWIYYILINIDKKDDIENCLKQYCYNILQQSDLPFFNTVLTKQNNPKLSEKTLENIENKNLDNNDYYFWNGFLWRFMLALTEPGKDIDSDSEILFDVFDRQQKEINNIGNQFIWSKGYYDKNIKIKDNFNNVSYNDWKKDIENNYTKDKADKFIKKRKQFILDNLTQ